MNIMDALRKVVVEIKKYVDNTKVSKVDGKELSSNDYTDIDKQKVSKIPDELRVIDNNLYLVSNGVVLDNSMVAYPEVVILDCGTSTNNIQ